MNTTAAVFVTPQIQWTAFVGYCNTAGVAIVIDDRGFVISQ